MTLYEIDFQIKQFLDSLMDSVDEETGEVKEIDPSELEALNEAREQKLENIALYIKNLEAESKAIKEEEKNLKERMEWAEKKAEGLRNLLSQSMTNAGETKFNTARCAISFRKSEAVVITDMDLLEDMYIKKKLTIDADKALIKKDLKAGLLMDGAHLEERQNIQIK